jgi:hypothetical protein
LAVNIHYLQNDKNRKYVPTFYVRLKYKWSINGFRNLPSIHIHNVNMLINATKIKEVVIFTLLNMQFAVLCFVLLSFFFWPVYCLPLFHLRLLITSLISPFFLGHCFYTNIQNVIGLKKKPANLFMNRNQRWHYCQHAHCECGRSCVRDPIQVKHASFRSTSTDSLARNLSECSLLPTPRTVVSVTEYYEYSSKPVCLVQGGHHHNPIKFNLFLPWDILKNVHLGFKQQSFAHSMLYISGIIENSCDWWKVEIPYVKKDV